MVKIFYLFYHVCSECLKCFYRASELRSHWAVHSDFKQFCCDLCGKDFKCKWEVPRHFDRCPARLGFSDILAVAYDNVYSSVA